MQTIIIAIMAVVAISTAKADGFKCEGVNTGINVQVYNHTNPSEGTRNAAVMIVSDSYINSPNKTIAKFTDENNTLVYQGYGLFQATVDLRYIESSKRGENIAGTKLGYLKNINLQVYTKYGRSTYVDKVFDSKLTYVKRTGEIIEEKAICTRYLKN
jgi:hypothetical protein